MKVLSIILGVLLVLCGFGCVIRPGQTFLETGYMIAIMLFICGIERIVWGFVTKIFGLEFVLGILGVIIGVFAIFRPESTLAIDVFLIYSLAMYFLLQGIFAIVTSIKIRKIAISKLWILGIVVGILSVILGIYSLVHPALTALTIGFLVGFYFIESGINMVVLTLGMTSNNR